MKNIAAVATGFIQILTLTNLLAARSLSAAETLVASEDSFVNQNRPNTNFGSSSLISVHGEQRFGFVKFDLDSLDDGEIASATLRLYVSQLARAGDFSINEVQSSWSEGSLTYSNMPAVNSVPEAISAVAKADLETYLEVDVTALVARWVSGSVVNNGISLRPLDPSLKVSFASRESSFEPELVLDLSTSDKPNFATVKKEGGDYSDPITAMNDRDNWCDVSSLSQSESCELLVGPGTFLLAEPLDLPDRFDVLGAGNSGSQRTELVAQSGVEAVIRLIETSIGSQGNVISDLRVRNSGGANGNVRGIWSGDPSEDGPPATIRNVSVEVSGGLVNATTGISLGRPVLRNVEVSVNGGSNAVGIFSSCADAADVRVRVTAFDAQSSVGWREGSDCEPPIVRFNVSAFGPNSIGMDFGTMGGERFAEGMVTTNSGVGIRSSGGSPSWRNVRVTATPTAIQLQFIDLALLDNIDVPISFAETALDVSSVCNTVQVTDSTLFGEIRVRDPQCSGASLRIDSSSIGAITVQPGSSVATSSVAIGSSKVTGPIVSGPDQVTCINVYDGNYQPIACD